MTRIILIASLLFAAIPCRAKQDTLVVVVREGKWPLFPKTPKENVPFTKLFIIVKKGK
jgi:hypothetical protein